VSFICGLSFHQRNGIAALKTAFSDVCFWMAIIIDMQNSIKNAISCSCGEQ